MNINRQSSRSGWLFAAVGALAISGTTPMDHRFLPRGAQGEGFRDLAIGTVGLRDVVDNARAAGFDEMDLR